MCMSDLMKNGQAVYRCIHYYAVFEYADDGINITFPDVPLAITCANNTEKGLFMAEDVLTLCLHGMRADELPVPTVLENIVLMDNCKPYLITVEMDVQDGKIVSDEVVEYL